MKITDTHGGNALQHTKGLKRAVEWVAEPGVDVPRFCSHGGDWCDCAGPGHPHFDSTIHPARRITQVYKTESSKYKPINPDQWLWLLSGNHDQRMSLYCDPIEDIICEKLKIPTYRYLGRSGVIELVSKRGKIMFRIYDSHPGKIRLFSRADEPERREVNMTLQMKRYLTQTGISNCLVMMLDHTHWLKIKEPEKGTYLYARAGKEYGAVHQFQKADSDPAGKYIDREQRWYVACGSSLKNMLPMGVYYKDEEGNRIRQRVHSYPEDSLMPPSTLGFPILKVRRRKLEAIEPMLL
jgi:hypothetical protein